MTRSEIGAVGVLNFFIVSGFLITLTIEVHYTRGVRRFLINRFLRIYPTLWVSMIVAVLAILLMGTTYVTANFYIRGWTWANILRCILIVPATGQNETWGPIPVGWTLQVEVSFYVVMAALFLLIGRLSQNKRHVEIICFCSASLLGYFVLMATTILAPSNGCRFVPFFVTGVITAIISRLETAQYAMRLFAGIVLTVALALCIKAVFFMGGLTPGYVIGTAVDFSFRLWIVFLSPVASNRGAIGSFQTDRHAPRRSDLSSLHASLRAQSGDRLLVDQLSRTINRLCPTRRHRRGFLSSCEIC